MTSVKPAPSPCRCSRRGGPPRRAAARSNRQQCSRLTARPALQDSDGPRKYAKKTLTLTVCEVLDISGRNPTDVGSIVLNLAEFASTDGLENERRLPLACSSTITAAVGQPMLACTIRCVRGAGCQQTPRALGFPRFHVTPAAHASR